MKLSSLKIQLSSTVALPLALVALLVLPSASLIGADSAPRPNILFIMADDVGWGDFQCYNRDGKVPSPNVDRLAREGMRFTDAHTPAALCAPTRYAVATGNYTWRGRLAGGTWGWNQEPQFLEGQKTIGHILQKAGYRTALFGKLHFGGVWESQSDGKPDFTRPMKVGPKEWGFDYSCVLLGGHQAPPYMFFENNRVDGDPAKVTELDQGPLNGGIVPVKGPGLPDWDSRKVGQKLVEKTVAFIDDCLARGKDGKQQPFYIHLSTDGAHGPYTPPDDLLGAPVKGSSKMTAHTDMVYEVDVVIGKLIEALEKRRLLANTLIVVTSDNGGIPADREHGHDAVGGLHGAKAYIWEGGHRVPFVVHWGDGTKAGSKVPPGTVRNQIIGTHDIVPTFAELAGAKLEPNQALDSISFASVFLGLSGDDKPVRQTLLIQSGPGRDASDERPTAATESVAKGKKKAGSQKARKQDQRKAAQETAGSGSHGMSHALREGPWKLVMDLQDKPAALYNLKEDLAETRNLIKDATQAERVKRMEKLYRDIRSSKRSTPEHTAG